MSPKPTARAASRYKQVRLQFTEEARGRVSVSLYVKPLNAEWNERQCLRRWTSQVSEPLETFEDVLSLLVRLLDEDLLPGIG